MKSEVTKNDDVDQLNPVKISIASEHNETQPDIKIRILKSFVEWFFGNVANTYTRSKNFLFVFRYSFGLAENMITFSRIEYIVGPLFNQWVKLVGPVFGYIDKKLGEQIVKLFVAALLKAGMESTEDNHASYQKRLEYLLFGSNSIVLDGVTNSEIEKILAERNIVSSIIEEKEERIISLEHALDERAALLTETEEMLHSVRLLSDQHKAKVVEQINRFREENATSKMSCEASLEQIEVLKSEKREYEDQIERMGMRIQELTEFKNATDSNKLKELEEANVDLKFQLKNVKEGEKKLRDTVDFITQKLQKKQERKMAKKLSENSRKAANANQASPRVVLSPMANASPRRLI